MEQLPILPWMAGNRAMQEQLPRNDSRTLFIIYYLLLTKVRRYQTRQYECALPAQRL